MSTTIPRREQPCGTHEPDAGEIAASLLAAFTAGDALDAHKPLRSGDRDLDLNLYFLAAARTDADADALAASFATGLTTSPAVVDDLTARRRSTPDTPHGQRAA